jgi:hypothetical protein
LIRQFVFGIIFKVLHGTERSGLKMEFIGYLAPIAFVFALSAMSQVAALKKEVDQLKGEIEKLKG